MNNQFIIFITSTVQRIAVFTYCLIKATFQELGDGDVPDCTRCAVDILERGLFICGEVL